VWSDNFTAAFFVRFNVTVFVADIKGIQSEVICLWIGTTTCSVNVTSTCSQWRNERLEPGGQRLLVGGPLVTVEDPTSQNSEKS